jgi:hypothetical protein
MQKRRRDLEMAIERVRKGLQEGKRRWRRLHHENRILIHRISAAQQPSLLLKQARTHPRSPLQAIYLAKAVFEPDPVGAVEEDIQLPAHPGQDSDRRKESENMVHCQVVKGPRHSRYNQHCAAPSPKPISAFKHHATVSFSVLSKYMTSQKFRSSSQSNHQALRQAFLMYQTETAERLNVPASKICWYLEWPYEASAERRLCSSFPALSGACKLTSMVAQVIMGLECLFLVMEHEQLTNAADPFFKPPGHPILDAPAPPLPTKPQLPDAAELATAFVRYSVTHVVQMHEALQAILAPLIRQSRCFLPKGKWLAVCTQMLQISQLTVSSLRSTSSQNPQESRPHATEAGTDQGEEGGFEV